MTGIESSSGYLANTVSRFAIITVPFMEVIFMEIPAETLEKFKEYTPEISISVLAEVSIQLIAHSNRISRMRMQRLQESYDRLDSEFERWKRKVRSNNWLKMHGQPMKRREV